MKRRLLTLTDITENPEKFFEAHRLLAERTPTIGPGFWIRFTGEAFMSDNFVCLFLFFHVSKL